MLPLLRLGSYAGDRADEYIGEVHTKNGGYPPGAKVYINKNGSPACDACNIPVKRDRTYSLETSLPPGTYTITAYSADYSAKSQTKPLKRGSNDHIDFELESPPRA